MYKRQVLAKPGVDKAALKRAIAKVLPRGVQVVSGQTVVGEETNLINSDLSFISTALLVFAFISLFVGAFTIFNTFSITVGPVSYTHLDVYKRQDVVMDKATATKYGFKLGNRVRVLLAGPSQTFTITGIVTFGGDNDLVGDLSLIHI